VSRSDFRVAIETERCTGCGACIRRCQFKALSKDGDVAAADYTRCVGCGVCVSACPVEAMSMERRPAGEVAPPARNLREWMASKAEERGISLDDVG
jgi:MinD superfamily P-loop ATPase